MCNLSERIVLTVKEEDAIGMIRENMSDEAIHRVTNLPLEQIANLRKQEVRPY